MIIESLLSFCVFFLKGLLSLVTSPIKLPIEMFSVLGNITSFGSWIIGSDLLLMFVSCVVFWTGLKITVGLAIFIWELLPLT